MFKANILITDKGTAVLADFGLSKISYEATTTTFQNAGSPRWMAPELILAGGKTTSPRKTQKSDIYAYGHVILEVLDFRSFTAHHGAADFSSFLHPLFQVLSNELPFSDLKEEVHVIVELIRGGRSVRPDGRIAEAWLDDVAWAISRRCTAIDPEERLGIQSVLYDLCRLRQNTVPGQNRRPHFRE
jgi:serine/threonine protein kinase